ncbi:hypothetical protein LV716_16395 [Flagellimonas sp. HMM57]|uniref:hypothetical protein n=1 Tax=unclassified Flagellimonas TaxID=2644544 RepID=UPI0013D5CE4F|nr:MULTISPECIES: hypothetical protein [unclassified Flagellimonas]UII75822.1 hypothetical protein LV716_16395 [Flagellimonas sp. HMM57]
MIKRPFYVFALSLAIISSSCSKDEEPGNSAETKTTKIPDDAFEKALISLDLDDKEDNLVKTKNIEKLTSLDIGNKAIEDLTGIADFKALKTLKASGNKISDVDLSKNVNLEQVDLAKNLLSKIDLVNNTKLKTLDLRENQIASINLSVNTALESLDVSANKLTVLDLSNNTALTSVSLAADDQVRCIQLASVEEVEKAVKKEGRYANWKLLNNPGLSTYCEAVVSAIVEIPDANFEKALIELNIDDVEDGKVRRSKVVKEEILVIDNKEITDLTGIEAFTGLKVLAASNNKLKTVDLSKNLKLEELLLDKNQIETIDLTANVALKGLSMNENLFKVVDVTKNTALETLRLWDNQLETIDLTKNRLLKVLFLTNNPLTNLDLSQNVALNLVNTFNERGVFLSCITLGSQVDVDMANKFQGRFSTWSINAVTGYAVDCTGFDEVTIYDVEFERFLISEGYDDVQDGKLTRLNVANVDKLEINNLPITDLRGIEAFKSLRELTITAIPDLKTLSFSGGKPLPISRLSIFTSGFTSLDLRELYGLRELEINSNNNLASIQLNEENNILDKVRVDNNALTKFDLSILPRLRTFWARANGFTRLDFSNNPELLNVDLNNSKNLTNLDFSNNLKLEVLNAVGSGLTSVNLLKNTELKRLELSFSKLNGIIGLYNCKKLERSYLEGNPDLSCIIVAPELVDDIKAGNGVYSDWRKDTTAIYITPNDPCN